MEVLDQIWQYVLPVGGGVTLGAMIIAVIVPIIKGVITKAVSKIDVEKIENTAVDKGLEKIKTVSFKQSIQPLCESELKKVTETANKYIKDQIDTMNENYTKLIVILTKLSAYFDNSIAVTEQAKAELKQALADAQNGIVTEQDITVEQDETTETEVVETADSEKSFVSVER